MSLPEHPYTPEQDYLNAILGALNGEDEPVLPDHPYTPVQEYLYAIYLAVKNGGGGVGIDVVVGWKAGTTPDVSKIPAGVTVTYQGTTYTGTKAAGEATKGQIVLVALPDGAQPNLYTEYITYKDGDNYGWEVIGTTQIDLTDYYTKAEADAKFLEASDLIPQGTITMYSIATPTVAETYDLYIQQHQA